MKRFMMISAVLVAVMAAGASSAKADHRHGGSTFGISIGYGNGLNNFNVGYGRGGFGNPYGGYNRFNSVPVYQPVRVYSAPVYSVPVYSAPVYGGGYGGYRHHRHCH
jgi:hypothetical protein